MLTTLFVLTAFAAVAFVGFVCLLGLLFHLVVGLVLLPFRLLGWVLWLPLLIVKGVLGLVAAVLGLILAPVLFVVAAIGAVILILTFVLPVLVPLAGIAFLVWLLLKASASPAAAA